MRGRPLGRRRIVSPVERILEIVAKEPSIVGAFDDLAAGGEAVLWPGLLG